MLHPDAYDTDVAWSDQPGLFDIIGEPEADTINQIHWWMHAIQNGHTPVYDTVSQWQKRDADAFTEYREAHNPAEVPLFQLGYENK